MALRWFFQAIVAGMIEGDKFVEDRARMARVREVEDDRKLGGEYGGMGYFQMPLHYPRYKKEDYERMEEWKLDLLLKEYGLACDGSLEEKRAYAMGAFLWPDQL